MQETYSISELGREFGISTRAIRFYEDQQLISPDRAGQRRIYSRSDRARLVLLLRGKRLGWQLSEIRNVLDMYDQGHEGEMQQLQYTCKKVEERREQLHQQLQDIKASMTDLDQIQARCEKQIQNLSRCSKKSGTK